MNQSSGSASSIDLLPNPPFEGSEKRIEMDFNWMSGSRCNDGLRQLTRLQLDELMTAAHCTIVSSRSNAHFDAYVLSESSLFVYPTKWVLKTCGTTKLLHSLPRLLEMVAQLGMEATRCKFSRASFLFPEQQHFPHTSFDDEVEYLDRHLAKSFDNTRGHFYVLGEPFEGLQWHVYANAKAVVAGPPPRPTYNLEICMTELGLDAAQQFFRTDAFVSAAQTTIDSGISLLKPGADIDDYVFEPCGYSMNGIDGTGLVTVHITPEPGHSYASVEVSGFLEDISEGPDNLLETALRIFRPGRASVTLSSSSGGAPLLISADLKETNLTCHAAATQDLDCGGSVVLYSLSGVSKGSHPPGSPTSILHHAASWLSITTGRSSPNLADSDSNESLGDNCACISNEQGSDTVVSGSDSDSF